MVTINDRTFSFQIASDVVRNSIGVELYEYIKGENVLVAEFVRNDTTRTIEFNASGIILPYEVLLELQAVFEAEIPKQFE
ncbi:hypothetical protein PALB_21570 [Pseudoalteromonas luteoviolacea B = ATCC 29581]|nr:hypothetical protein PALB_21570 [Pseudoalteromonas luteoviolacea B = ATCC 29581]